MKKYQTLVWAAVLSAAVGANAGRAVAAEDGPLKKLGRGVTNMIEGPAEFYAQTVLMKDTTDPLFNLVAGSVKGFGMFLVREAVGIYDIVTFPVPVPLGYKPLIRPATTFTDWDARQPQTRVNPRPNSLPPE